MGKEGVGAGYREKVFIIRLDPQATDERGERQICGRERFVQVRWFLESPFVLVFFEFEA